MKKSGNFFKIGILCWLMSIQLWAQVQLKAQVSTNQIGINEKFLLEYSINKENTQHFKLPNLNNFEIVQGPSQSVSQSWINGKTSFMATYSYVLVPKKKGVLKIAPASLFYKGKKILSNAITITVSGNSTLTKVPNANDAGYTENNQQAKKSVHLVTVVNKEQLYVGEPMYVEYRLYMSNVGISINKFNKLGAYEGFWVHDFVDKQTIRKETVYKGVPSVYYVLKRSLLIPQKDGKLTIQPMEANIAVEVPTNKVDFFGEVITKTVNQTYQSEQKIIYVKSLPTKGKPANFNGAVGNFKMDFVKPKQPYQTNQSNLLAVKISGKGNFKLFDFPGIQTSSSIEVYPPETKENLVISDSGIAGNISQKFTLVPNKKGNFNVNSQPFSYFNPIDGKYHTIQANKLAINVIQGVLLQSSNKDSNFPLQGIETDITIQPLAKDFYGSIFYWISIIIGLLFIPISGWYVHQHQIKTAYLKANPKLTALQKSEKLLDLTLLQVGNKTIFYEQLNEVLLGYIATMLVLTKQELSKENIIEQLQIKNIPSSMIEQLIQLITTVEMIQYAPITTNQMEEDLKETRAVLTSLNSYLV